MKLLRLAVQRMGALRNSAVSLPARISVLTASNEAGKTTFIDALLAALFGVPDSRKADGKRFAVRYEGVAEGLEAEIQDGEERIVVTPESPLNSPGRDPETLRTLLVIRSGESAIYPEKGFLDRFAARTLGAGLADLTGAIDVLERIANPPSKASLWKKTPASWLTKVEDFKRRLGKVSEGDAAMVARTGLEAALAANTVREKSSQEELKGLAAAASEGRRRRLATHKAEIEEATGKLAAINAPSRAQLAELRVLAETGRKEADARSSAVARLERSRRELEQIQAQLKAAQEKRAARADPASLAALRGAYDDVERNKSAREAAGGKQLVWLPYAGAALAALAAGAFVYQFARSWPGAGAAAAIVGIGAFFGLRSVSNDARPGASAALTAAINAFEARRDALGGAWVGLEASAVKARIESESTLAAGADALASDCVERLKTATADHAAANAEAAKPEGPARGRLADSLRSYGVENLVAAEEKTTAREHLESDISRSEKAAKNELGRDLKAGEAIGVAIRRAIDELDLSRAEVPQALRDLSPEETEQRRRQLNINHENVLKERQALELKLRDADRAVSDARDQEGLSAAELDLRRRKAEKFLLDIEGYREAAKVAQEELKALQEGTDTVVRECVAEASQVLSRLTDGRYSSLEVADSALDSDSFTVQHQSEGRKALEWMSTGAQDMVWFAMRLALAKRAFPQGAFLILDEPFHNLDPERALLAMRALAAEDVLPGWQVLILTKDPAAAQIMQNAGLLSPEGRLSF